MLMQCIGEITAAVVSETHFCENVVIAIGMIAMGHARNCNVRQICSIVIDQACKIATGNQ